MSKFEMDAGKVRIRSNRITNHDETGMDDKPCTSNDDSNSIQTGDIQPMSDWWKVKPSWEESVDPNAKEVEDSDFDQDPGPDNDTMTMTSHNSQFQPENYDSAIKYNLDQNRNNSLEKEIGIRFRLKEELKTLKEVLDDIQAKLEALGKAQEALSQVQRRQDAQLQEVRNKVMRSSGFFASIFKAIPVISNVYSAFEAVKDGYDTVKSVYESGKSMQENIKNCGNALLGKATETVGAFLN